MNPYWLGMVVGYVEGTVVTLFICAVILIFKEEKRNDKTFLEKQDSFV